MSLLAEYHRHADGSVVFGIAERCVDPDARAENVTVLSLDEGAFAEVVERVMYAEGWVCNPADHEGIPKPGECINCDGERHRLGFRLHAALHHRPHPETQACPHPACPGWAS